MVTRRGGLALLLCSVYICSGPRASLAVQAVGAGQAKAACGADLTKSLAGKWKAPQYKMKRASDVGTQVFGPNAFDIKDVELTLESSGEGVLKISTSVLDQKGKSWAPTIIELKLMVGAPPTSAAGKCEPVVTVVSTEERYLDETNYHTTLDGSRVMIATDPTAKQIEVRFEPPKGEGSFWSTLTRQVAPPAGNKPSTN
jgi:hypothetical protein